MKVYVVECKLPNDSFFSIKNGGLFCSIDGVIRFITNNYTPTKRGKELLESKDLLEKLNSNSVYIGTEDGVEINISIHELIE